MLALRKTAPAPGLELLNTSQPDKLAENEVMIAVAAAGVCGSDLHVDDWSAGYEFMVPLLPVTLGHEFSGRVVAVGSAVRSVSVGQRVTAWPSAPCGVCRACKTGRPQNCSDKRTVGLYRDGAFATHTVARESGVFPLPESVDFELAALVEPLCVGARAVNVGEIRQGQKVVVLGPGTIGQAIALFARLSGAISVAVAGFDDGSRLSVLNKLGFEDTFDLAEAGSADELFQRFGNADAVFEATGHASSIADGLRLLRNEGTLVLTGIHAEPTTINLLEIVRRKLQIRGSHGSRREDWARVIDTLEHRGEEFRGMITHRLPLSRALEGFALARERSASKVLILPDEREAQS
ncbi:zinc-dependent alcohol dehydrogenase [Tianweitania sediminis]|uniref:Alcohol dehydrogenase catalytic domain-containing protein n=1 Tax=Tianweitania sediminis TaxID=1502156 RepID=A0A8J7QZI6_9HYPH|nr:alcohol dehydrogenase catalytic domain-containing protein [Tianweitania sediminis]MBP0437713.1 alcohol dehydrogenase catalytic domain-containing protein [Tianweitania sediminis]